jgi:exonuclease III
MEVKSFFDIVSIILEKKPYPSDEDIQKHCNPYMVGTMLSCDPQLVEIAYEMSKLKISNKMYFDCLYNGIPKCKKYIKWNANKAKKEQNIKYLIDYFKVSPEIAKQYVGIIAENEMQFIISFFEKRGVAK